MTLGHDLEQIWRSELAACEAWSLSVALGDESLVSIDADRVYPGASMIKTFLALLVADGSLSWESPCPVVPEMVAPGDGVLRGFALPVTLSMRDVCLLMLAVSDNTATNAVVGALGGVAAVNDRLEQLGYHSRLHRLAGAGDDPRGLSTVTAEEHMSALLALIGGSAPARAMFEAQQDRRSLARHLAEDAVFAHKTGTADGVRHDAGVLRGPGGEELRVSVFTDGPPRPETTDDPACLAMARGMARTLDRLGWSGWVSR